MESATDYLAYHHPGRPWILSAIDPDGVEKKKANPRTKIIESKAFPPGDSQAADAQAWVDGWNGKWNLYYDGSVPIKVENNPVSGKNCQQVVAFHVDVDAAGDAGPAEMEKTWEAIKAGQIPKPSTVIMTGGGFQLLFNLQEPIPVQGQKENLNMVKAYNDQLAAQVGGDGCGDATHLLRLPFTTNLPNKRKRDRGRVPVEATVKSFNGPTYPIEQFTMAPVTTAASVRDLNLPEDLPRLATIDDLDEWYVPNSLKVIAVQGHDPGNPKDPGKDNSRSAWVFHLACGLVRCAVPPKVICGILLDPGFKISESVLEKGDRAREYAEKQVKDAIGKSPRLLDPQNADLSARLFLADNYPHIVHSAKVFTTYVNPHWEEQEDGTIRQALHFWLRGAEVKYKEATKPFPINPSSKNSIIDSVISISHKPAGRYSPPCWLGDEAPFPAGEVMACANGLLHLPSGVRIDASPNFYTLNALDYNYQPKLGAEPVEWIKFMESLWPDDPELIDLLQETMGYFLIPSTWLQKMFVLVGPPRGGKGTIARIIQAMIGLRNCCGVTARSLAGEFGLSGLVGKSLGTMPDVRISHRTDVGALMENLLGLTGGDMLPVNRKYLGAVDMYLKARLLLMTNEMPTWPDESGALANRMVPLPLTNSWLNQEDHGLEDRLMAELPQILNWSIVGWNRLHERGRLNLPEKSKALIRHTEAEAGGVTKFVSECCTYQEHGVTMTDDLLAAYQDWCGVEEVEPLTVSWFHRKLNTTGRGRVVRTRGRNQDRYTGIVLLEEVEAQTDMPF